MDTQVILDLLAQNKYVALAALCIGLIVRLLKSDTKIPIDIPPRARFWLGLGLSLVAGVLEKLGTGLPWKQAMLDGLVAWGLAVLGHNAVIDSLRGGKEFAIPGLMVPGAPPSPGKPPSIPPREKDTELPPPPKVPPLMMLMLVFALAVGNSGCAWLKANGPEMAINAGQMACLIISQDLPDSDVAKVCNIAQPLWGPMKEILANLRSDSAKRMADAAARQEMKDRQEQALERLKELRELQKWKAANDNDKKVSAAPRVTIYQGKKYRATIHLSWAESFAADSTIMRTAQAKLIEAGFSSVRVFKSGDIFYAEGTWNKETTTAPLDDHLRDVKEVP